MDKIVLAIDIGGSKYVVSLVTREGVILAKRRGLWPGMDADSVTGELIGAGQALLTENLRYTPSVIGATIPGLADPLNGIWLESSFSGIRNVPLTRILSDAFALPAYADNDGQACALAEKLFGSCRDVSDFMYVTVSNGIGGALFLHNKLYPGSFGKAGEIGHCVAVEGGRSCACGTKGCLEMHAAGPGITRNYAEFGGSPAQDGTPASAELIAARAAAGEQAALRTYQAEGVLLGRALAFAANLLNPARIIIGGGVSLAYALFSESLEATLRAGLYQGANPNLTVGPTALGYDGGLLGAAAVAFCREEGLYTDLPPI